MGKKLISIPSKSAKEYGNMAEYVKSYIDKVSDVLCGVESSGVEGEGDIDYGFIFDRIKAAAESDFPNDFNIFPESIESQNDLQKLYMTILESYDDNSHQPRLKCTCKECGKEFYIYNNDVEFYKKNNYDLPRRCKECRKKRRDEKKASEASTDAE